MRFQSSNDNRPPSRIKRFAARFTLPKAYDLLFAFTERFASTGLAVHFLLFLGVPFIILQYSVDRIMGKSQPDVIDGFVPLKVSLADWRGFFWMMNFFGALVLCVIVIYGLYILWNVGLKKRPLQRLLTKTILCAAVALGMPLKFVYRVMMHIPKEWAPDLDFLGVIHITDIARSNWMSWEGAWFLSKFAVLPPILFCITYIIKMVLDKRAAEAKGIV